MTPPPKGEHIGPRARLRAAALVGVLFLLGGCGGSGSGAARSGALSAYPAANLPSARSSACAPTVLGALARVAVRVYREGVSSERTRTAFHYIASSLALREAVSRGDARATTAAAEALIATGHLTNLRVVSLPSRNTSAVGETRVGAVAARVLTDVGSPAAMAPLMGTLLDARGHAIARYQTSVEADDGFIAETQGLTEGKVALRAGSRSIAHSFAMPTGALPAEGTLSRDGTHYQYTSFPAAAYPSGALRVYLLRSMRSIRPLCGASAKDTVVKVISRVARLIYFGEAGHRTLAQIERVQQDSALLQAVARRDPIATTRTVAALLNQHIVRLRILDAEGSLLADLGGPFVLAPVHATLRLGARAVGSFVLSIQDDLGYLLLAHRLVGLEVLMHRGSELIMSSLHPPPSPTPVSGDVQYQGHDYHAFTFDAQAFPSGPLRITVLIPLPYT